MVEFLLARLSRTQMEVHISPWGGLKVRGRRREGFIDTVRDEHIGFSLKITC